MNTEIGAVIVTFNRLDKLKCAVEAFEKQTVAPKYIIVVDNASTDGTKEYLQKWKAEKNTYEKHVITMKKNCGGSGGFYTGLKKALNGNADWIWVSDDDAFPCLDALERAQEYFISNEEKLPSLSAICGQVMNHGKTDITHRKIYGRKGIKITEQYVPEQEYKKYEFELNSFTYVGTIMSKEKIKRAGLPNKGFFIWWDDLEHGLRMSRIGKIVCVPAIKIHHNVEEETSLVNWKRYYGYRNMIATYKEHFPGICYWYFCLKIWIKITLNFLTGEKKAEINILKDAFFDARKHKFGIHPIYKPGWKLSEKQDGIVARKARSDRK